jgi:hypothetical protein
MMVEVLPVIVNTVLPIEPTAAENTARRRRRPEARRSNARRTDPDSDLRLAGRLRRTEEGRYTDPCMMFPS